MKKLIILAFTAFLAVSVLSCTKETKTATKVGDTTRTGKPTTIINPPARSSDHLKLQPGTPPDNITLHVNFVGPEGVLQLVSIQEGTAPMIVLANQDAGKPPGAITIPPTGWDQTFPA